MIVVQIFVYNSIFGSIDICICEEFSKCKSKKFEMSTMGELKFFLGLQVKQTNDRIFINQNKYILDMLKRFDMDKLKSTNTLMSSFAKLDKDDEDTSVDVTTYRGMIRSLFYLITSKLDIMFSPRLVEIFRPKK